MPRNFDAIPPRILIHPADLSAGAYYRTVGPGIALRQAGHALTLASHKYLTDEQLRTLMPDVVVFQRQHQPEQIEAMRRYRRVLPRATSFVYEIDDLLWDIPNENPAHAAMPSNVKSLIREAVKLCDVVVTSTAPLAEAMRAAFKAKNIRVVQNYLPRAFVHAAEAGRRAASGTTHDKPRVGWAGGTSHAGDLAILTDVVKALKDEVQFVFMGMVPPGVFEGDVEYHEAVPLDGYAEALGRLDLDLALAPLANNAFNMSKSNLRLLEFGACGYPVIASMVHPFVSSPVFFPDTNRPDDWVIAIRKALANKSVLYAAGENMHEWVKDHFILEDRLGYWARGWAPNMSTAFYPGDVDPLHDLVTVGADIPGVMRASSIEDAWVQYPGCNVLYMREGTALTSDQAERMVDLLGENASVSTLNNEGLYPVQGQFVTMSPELAEKIDGSVGWADGAPVPVPFPSGPCVLLSGAALSRVGLPDVERFNGDTEGALLDWGSRTMEAGKPHILATNVFTLAAQRVARGEQSMTALVDHVMAWMPYFGQMASQFGSLDPLKGVRETVDLVFNRQNYLGPVGRDKEAELPKSRVLVINGTEEDAKAFYGAGELAFCTTLNGHGLHFTYPAMPNVQPLDMRETTDDMLVTLNQLAIDRVVFCGIGNGTIGAIGYLAVMADRGVPVEYRPSPVVAMYDKGDPSGYVDEAGWTATWAKLLPHLKKESSSAMNKDCPVASGPSVDASDH